MKSSMTLIYYGKTPQSKNTTMNFIACRKQLPTATVKEKRGVKVEKYNYNLYRCFF